MRTCDWRGKVGQHASGPVQLMRWRAFLSTHKSVPCTKPRPQHRAVRKKKKNRRTEQACTANVIGAIRSKEKTVAVTCSYCRHGAPMRRTMARGVFDVTSGYEAYLTSIVQGRPKVQLMAGQYDCRKSASCGCVDCMWQLWLW